MFQGCTRGSQIQDSWPERRDLHVFVVGRCSTYKLVCTRLSPQNPEPCSQQTLYAPTTSHSLQAFPRVDMFASNLEIRNVRETNVKVLMTQHLLAASPKNSQTCTNCDVLPKSGLLNFLVGQGFASWLEGVRPDMDDKRFAKSFVNRLYIGCKGQQV